MKKTNNKTNVIEFDDFSEYEPIDLEACFDMLFYPPEEQLKEWRREREAQNPFNSTILRKIGNTWYEITTDCEGTESLAGKVKRLIFEDPCMGKEVIAC